MSGSLENRHRSHLVVSHCLQNKQKSFSGLTLYIEWIHHFYILVQLFLLIISFLVGLNEQYDVLNITRKIMDYLILCFTTFQLLFYTKKLK